MSEILQLPLTLTGTSFRNGLFTYVLMKLLLNVLQLFPGEILFAYYLTVLFPRSGKIIYFILELSQIKIPLTII